MRRNPRHGLAAAATALVLAFSTGAAAEPQKPVEVDAVPIVGGDSDIGWGGGGVAALAKYGPGDDHRLQWRLDASAFLTFNFKPHFDAPYQDHWLQLMVPDLAGGRVRIQTRVAFTKENFIRYFGLGNAVRAPPNDNAPFYIYGRTHPILEGYVRVALVSSLYVIEGATFTGNWLDVPANSLLAQDMANGSPEVRKLLGSDQNHAVVLAQQSVGWDTRDNEVIPRTGTWEQVDLRLSPSVGSLFPYGYGEVLAVARGYVPIGSRVVLAGRALGDFLFGDPPFYQLAEYEDTYAIGGTAGIRGVPAQRYYGKIKLIGNVEVRTDIARFEWLHKPWGLDLVAFFDAGRLWADWSSQPQLDGTGLGLKYGTGLGIRMIQGTALVVRGDVAWSPDAEPIGGYFAAGEMF